ncbi:hypothetical protein QYF36_012694 [Acer negundo]|nr:hypothetical protein QYF36_012694 [Acer negundo]
MVSIPTTTSASDILHRSKSVAELKQIHGFLIKTGRPQTQLCDFSCNESIRYTHLLIKHLENPDTQLYNNIIQCLSSSNSLETIVLYREMLAKGLIPDNYTIPYVLKACARSQALKVGQQIHAHSLKTALLSNVYVFNTLMRLYAVCGLIKAVHKLFHFHQGPQRDLVSWTTLIQACVKMGYPRDAILAFFDMCQANLRPDGMTLVILLSACSKLGDLTLGTKIHRYIYDNNLDLNSDIYVHNALIDMYLKCGSTRLASKCEAVGRVADIIQIPAFLCRQTDLLVAAANTGKIINIKKGQSCALFEMQVMENSAEKIRVAGNENVMSREIGTMFDYRKLVDLFSIALCHNF